MKKLLIILMVSLATSAFGWNNMADAHGVSAPLDGVESYSLGHYNNNHTPF
jgi:hypothetical protein